MMFDRQPIVITGIGLITSLGNSAEQTWKSVLNRQPSLGPMPALERPTPDGKGGYQAVDLPEDYEPTLPREARYLHYAIRQAIADAGQTAYHPARCGFAIGTTLHGMRAGGEFLRSGDYSHLGSFLAGSTLELATRGLPMLGDAVTTCSACSSSLGSVALAVTLLQSGALDLVITGGYDAVSEYAYAGFNSLRLVTDGPLRPFTKGRNGMKLGEGYAILVMERQREAKARKARIHATVLGWGESADAHHLTQPHPQGRGAAEAMSAALSRANLQPADVGLIAAHATGTPDNDAGEHAALAATFGAHLPDVPVVAFKSHLGHTLGAAGAAELILSILALQNQQIPPTTSVKADEIEFSDLMLNTSEPRPAVIRATLNTSLGFGGANTCVVVGPADAKSAAKEIESRAVCITGIGMVLPGGIGAYAINAVAHEGDTGTIPEALYLSLLNARRIRRMSEYVKLSLAATVLALRHGGIEWPGPWTESCSTLLGSTHGGTQYCADYYRKIVEGGWVAANPMLFAEGVPNAAAAHLSLMLSLKGGCQTVIGSRTAGLDALRLASLRIATGEWDRAIVGAAEEYSTLVNEGYRHCGLYGGSDRSAGFATGSGAVTLLLESRESVTRRGGVVFGRVIATASRRLGGRAIESVESVANLLVDLGVLAPVVGSANGTWVGGVEMAAAHRAGRTHLVSPIADLPELFSVGPLAQAGAALLAGTSPFDLICTGYTGIVTGARFYAG